jgi:hypothetical protein
LNTTGTGNTRTRDERTRIPVVQRTAISLYKSSYRKQSDTTPFDTTGTRATREHRATDENTGGTTDGHCPLAKHYIGIRKRSNDTVRHYRFSRGYTNARDEHTEYRWYNGRPLSLAINLHYRKRSDTTPSDTTGGGGATRTHRYHQDTSGTTEAIVTSWWYLLLSGGRNTTIRHYRYRAANARDERTRVPGVQRTARMLAEYLDRPTMRTSDPAPGTQTERIYVTRRRYRCF